MAGHNHDHSHSPADFGWAFLIGTVLNLTFVVVEAVFGLIANSTALLADAGHNLSDVFGLLVAWAGAALVKRKPSARFSYGLKKSSILAALINALVLLVAVGAIIAEALQRLSHPEPSNGRLVMIVAAVGILVNGITAWLFAKGRHDDINIRGAFLHMTADAAVSAAVVVAGYLMIMTGALWIDPIISLLVAAFILWGTWSLLTESVSMTLAGVPKGIDPDQVSSALSKLPGVEDTHHLHIWALSTTETALTVHLVVGHDVNRDVILRQARAYVHQLFGISHSTIQVEHLGAEAEHHCHEGHHNEGCP
ncbi:cation diffusion facilitator family transporter [Sphingomonas daechungensis]|uniref:cation diffusion facilitator family transporter n=1 Tax=Sphingomonas daechungensis TaxID=1176646 RepID=UPI0037846A0D